MEIIIFFIAAFFSLNMGAPSFAGSFSTACGSKVLTKRQAGFLFIPFALFGALLLGSGVASTLSKGIVPQHFLTTKAVSIILFCATLSLFTANMIHIPQSTSFSTLASICGVGMYYHAANWDKIRHLAVYWILSTVFSFLIIYWVSKYFYPPRTKNFWIYERIVHHRERLKHLVIWTSCYKGFAQGTNNVANAVGPLSAAGLIDVHLGLVMLGILFGLGALTFTGPMDTSIEKIVPLGLLSATVINLVTGSMTIVASKLGIPFPTVIVYTAAIFAIGGIKNGLGVTASNPITLKALITWCVNPIITFFLSFTLSKIFLG